MHCWDGRTVGNPKANSCDLTPDTTNTDFNLTEKNLEGGSISAGVLLLPHLSSRSPQRWAVQGFFWVCKSWMIFFPVKTGHRWLKAFWFPRLPDPGVASLCKKKQQQQQQNKPFKKTSKVVKRPVWLLHLRASKFQRKTVASTEEG